MRGEMKVMVAALTGAWSLGSTAGCGSDEPPLDNPPAMTCGAGTVAVGGECVPLDGGTGGTSGVGGGAGSGGAAGQGGTGGTAGGSTGGEDGGTDAAGEAGAGGGPGPDDDPCPPGPIELDCSDQCGGPTATCTPSSCAGSEDMKEVRIVDPSLLPFVFRTPSRPGADPACVEACGLGGTPAAYAMAVFLYVPVDETKDFKVTVAPPWRVTTYGTDMKWACLDDYHFFDCVVRDGNTYRQVIVQTDDPNAPARNVVIDNVPTPGSCP